MDWGCGSLESLSPFGETGGPRFQAQVTSNWEMVARKPLPSFPFVRDELRIYRRRAACCSYGSRGEGGTADGPQTPASQAGQAGGAAAIPGRGREVAAAARAAGAASHSHFSSSSPAVRVDGGPAQGQRGGGDSGDRQARQAAAAEVHQGALMRSGGRVACRRGRGG